MIYPTKSIALAVAALAAASRMMAADELPKGDTILDKFVETTGGVAVYEKNHNQVTAGTMEMAAMGIKGDLTFYQSDTNQSYMVVDIPGVGKIQEGVSGKVAWQFSAMQGARIKDGNEKALAMRSAKWGGEAHWRDTYSKVETTGSEMVDGKSCWVVAETAKEGPPATAYFDKDTGLLAKMTMTVTTPMGEVQADTLFSDYRKENGNLMPHKIHQSAGGQEIVISFDSVKFNVDLPKDRFDPPAEIQALLTAK